jgi:hypothetical protein
VTNREQAITVIWGMALMAAAAIAGDQAVRTELEEEYDLQDSLTVRVFIGERSGDSAVTQSVAFSMTAGEGSFASWTSPVYGHAGFALIA